MREPSNPAYIGPWHESTDGLAPLNQPCDRFRLDYYTDSTVAHRPEHRYCECGWTQAHHTPAGSATPTEEDM